MNKKELQFLKFIHYKCFELSKRESELMGTHDFPDHDTQIRNDQSITEVRNMHKTLKDIAEAFVK